MLSEAELSEDDHNGQNQVEDSDFSENSFINDHDDDDDHLSGLDDDDLDQNEPQIKPQKAKEMALADAMKKILAKPIDTRQHAPILAKSLASERQLDQEKLLSRAKAQLRRERHAKLNRDHVVLVETQRNKRRKAGDEVEDSVSIAEEPEEEKRCWNPSTEQRFRKMATKGVVKLFNALQQQQQQLTATETTKTTTGLRRDKALKETKKAFVDALKQPIPAPATSSSGNSFAASLKKASMKKATASESTSATENSAAFLKQDFMMGGLSYKDWDKNDETELEEERENELVGQ